MWNKWIPFWAVCGIFFFIQFLCACFAHQNNDDPSNWINWKLFWFLLGIEAPILLVIFILTKIL
jgi:hypothetical protein